MPLDLHVARQRYLNVPLMPFQRIAKQIAAIGFFVIFFAALLGMDAPRNGDAQPLTAAIESPPFIRAEVPAGSEIHVPLELTLTQPATLLTAEVDCRCVSLIETTPRPLPTGRSTLTLRVVGLLPGTKRVTLRTTAGIVEVIVQVAVPGADSGMGELRSLTAEAAKNGEKLVLIVHQLGGRLRNCGCSTGSLGGIDHLAGLPTALRDLGATNARCVLTGDIAGVHAELDAALAKRGWEIHPADLPLSAEPMALLGQSNLLAVIDTSAGTPVANQRIVRPLLDGGAAATVLIIGADGRIHGQQVLPIDQSLPADAGILAEFPEEKTISVAVQDQVTSCANCHPAAVKAWSSSKHAHAWASLRPEQQVDVCISCHTSPGSGRQATMVRVTDVSCVSCHQGAEAHAAAPAKIHTAGATDCRSCHDSIHHPGFDRQRGWELIQHGR